MNGTIPNGHGGHYATALCARREVNPATAESNGVCEERVLRFEGDARWPLQGHETECAGCHLATCTTFGIHGDAVWRSGRLDPDPDDPRNRGIETGDAWRTRLRERLGA